MVCLPCIFLPVLMAIYIKFIQPYIYRILPQSWVNFLDPILYPTCPAKPPGADEEEEKKNTTEATEGTATCCGGGDTKKDQ